MKKVVLSAVSVFMVVAFTSCEKSYTCTCTYPNGNIGTTETTFKSKKDDAQAQCSALNASAQVNDGACALN